MYAAIQNVPGYLPMDDEPPTFETARDAWQYLVGEIERSWDEDPDDANGAHIEAHTQLPHLDQSQPGAIHAPTPGDDGSHDLGMAYCVVEIDDDDTV